MARDGVDGWSLGIIGGWMEEWRDGLRIDTDSISRFQRPLISDETVVL
jgi:hypothetical protein